MTYNPKPSLLEIASSPETLNDPYNQAFCYSLAILDEMGRLGLSFDRLSDRTMADIVSVLQDVTEISHSLKVHPSKLKTITSQVLQIVDNLESNYSGNPDGSAQQRFRQLQQALERRTR